MPYFWFAASAMVPLHSVPPWSTHLSISFWPFTHNLTPGGPGEPGRVPPTSARPISGPVTSSTLSSHHSGSGADALALADVPADRAGDDGARPVLSHA